MTKQEQKDTAWKAYKAIQVPAYEAYEAIQEPAWKAYEAEIERINNEPDEDIIEVDGKRYQLIKKSGQVECWRETIMRIDLDAYERKRTNRGTRNNSRGLLCKCQSISRIKSNYSLWKLWYDKRTERSYRHDLHEAITDC